MTVSEMFEQYRINKAVFSNLLTEIKYLEKETIEALQLPAYALSHIPRSETNKIHQPTEEIAIRTDSVNHEAIKALKQITKEIEKVDNLVNMLNEREKFVIVHKHIKCMSWRQISAVVEQSNDIDIPLSKCTLKNDKKRAEAFLQEAINQLQSVGNFIYESEDINNDGN